VPAVYEYCIGRPVETVFSAHAVLSETVAIVTIGITLIFQRSTIVTASLRRGTVSGAAA
jgi:hypothetical protein